MNTAKEYLAAFPAFCILCKEPIPLERLVRRAVTCKKEHAADLRKLRDKLSNSQGCTHCRRPCTPEEKALWRQFRESLPGHTKKPAGRHKANAQTVRN